MMRAPLPDLEFIWAMGLFEGEGSINMTRNESGKIISRQVCMNMTDFDIMERFYDAVGVGYLRGPYQRYGNKPCWTWTVASWEDIKPLLHRMMPHLGQRRIAQAELLLANPPLTLEARIRARAMNLCANGHELTEDNIYRRGNRNTIECLTCKRDGARDNYHKRKAANDS